MIIIGLTLIMNWVNSDHISKNWIHSLFHIRSHFCSPVEVVEVEDESTQLEKEEQELLKDLSSGEWSDTLADQEKRVGELEKASKRLSKIHKQKERLMRGMKRKQEWRRIRTTVSLGLKKCVHLCYEYWNSILSCLLLGLMTIGGDYL